MAEQIRRLLRFSLRKESKAQAKPGSQGECLFCAGHLRCSESLTLPCGHKLHVGCFRSWLDHMCCPECGKAAASEASARHRRIHQRRSSSRTSSSGSPLTLSTITECSEEDEIKGRKEQRRDRIRHNDGLRILKI
ncbi:unnamed protein product [Effrenium voratum]|uniref:RING-type domain-containing protein n=1 Tax=Effrenium voratum TaxID=2562239 RepID=A0AA36I548_9DINO|nr:unnamed protein product [Effrenium voratum]